jgi:hypothetical protein
MPTVMLTSGAIENGIDTACIDTATARFGTSV